MLFFCYYSIIGFFKLGQIVKCYGGFSCGNYSNLRVGSNVSINGNVYIQARESVVIGNDVVLSRGVSIFDAGLDLNDKKFHISKPVILSDHVWIGANSIILPGVTLGKNVIVGAGSVVTKSFPDNAIVSGNPAKLIRYL